MVQYGATKWQKEAVRGDDMNRIIFGEKKHERRVLVSKRLAQKEQRVEEKSRKSGDRDSDMSGVREKEKMFSESPNFWPPHRSG